MTNDKPEITLAEIKNDAVFLTREYRNSGGMQDELVQIYEEHYDWLIEQVSDIECHKCGGRDRGGRICSFCKNTGKEHNG